MNKTTEALKLAEEALEELHYSSGTVKAVTLYKSALAAIREALAEQPLLEPEGRCKECMAYNDHLDYCSKAKPVKQEPVATEHPLVAYAESYEQIARSGSSGKVSALAVATDIRQNMIQLTAANVDLSVLRPRNWTREMSDAWHRAIPNLEKAFDDLIAAYKEKNK